MSLGVAFRRSRSNSFRLGGFLAFFLHSLTLEFRFSHFFHSRFIFCDDSRGCDDDSRCFDGSECSTLAGEECDDWAGGESTETRGRCNGELDDADEDNKEDA